MSPFEITAYSIAVLVSLGILKISYKLWGPSVHNKYDLPGETASVPACLFCQFIRDRSNILFEDDQVIAFHDINPFASPHLLVIPKRHIKNLKALKNSDIDLIMHMKSVGLHLSSTFSSDCQMIFHRPAFNSILHLHCHVMIYPLTRPVLRNLVFNQFFSVSIDSVINSLKSKSS